MTDTGDERGDQRLNQQQRSDVWLNDDEDHAWQAFLTAHAQVLHAVERQLKAEHGLTHIQYEILHRLDAAGADGIRMSVLAASLVTTRGGLTYQVNQLEDAGWIERMSCRDDERGIVAIITSSGRAALRAATPDHVAAVRNAIFDRLSVQETRQLGVILGKFIER